MPLEKSQFAVLSLDLEVCFQAHLVHTLGNAIKRDGLSAVERRQAATYEAAWLAADKAVADYCLEKSRSLSPRN
jgi:hypothetical protein